MARFWDWLVGRPLATAPASPFSDGGDLVTITVREMFGDALQGDIVTRDIAGRVPGLRRALGAHLAIIGSAVWRQYENEALVAEQPTWLSSSASGISPYHRMLGLAGDLFWYGWAMLGCELDGDQIIDAVHVPYGWWTIDQTTGEAAIDHRVDARYRQRQVLIPLGLNGVLVDGIDAIEDARFLTAAVKDRIENPIPQTELHLTEDVNLSSRQKRKLAEEYNAGRTLKGGATSVTPHNVEVKLHGTVSADLFESGRNANRLDLANHALVPASIIEGAKNGSSGDMTYSNAAGNRAELYDFGTSLFVMAIQARLSMDDVCPPGQSIRADLSSWTSVPTPAQTLPVED